MPWREKNFKLVEDEWPRLRAELVKRGQLPRRDRELACMFMAQGSGKVGV